MENLGMRAQISIALMLGLLGLSGCDREADTLPRGLIDDAVSRTLESGSATVQGELVYEELEESEVELLAMTGQVNFDHFAQSLEFSDSQAPPGDPAELIHVISKGRQYFIDSEGAVSGYPPGTEWVRVTFDESADEVFPDLQTLMEPLIAINLLRGFQSAEELDSSGPEETKRYRVIVDFEEAARVAPDAVSHRLAPFDKLTYEEGLEEGLAPITVEIDDEGLIRAVRTALPYYGAQSGELSAYQSYTVRFVAFGGAISIETPSKDITADYDPDLYIEGLTPPKLRSEELETAANTCANDLAVTGSLKAMAREWDVKDPPQKEAALINAIASKYVERYYAGLLSGNGSGPPDLVKVTTEGCARGILRGLERLE